MSMYVNNVNNVLEPMRVESRTYEAHANNYKRSVESAKTGIQEIYPPAVALGNSEALLSPDDVGDCGSTGYGLLILLM